MIEVVALLMFLNGELTEYRKQPDFGKCLERARVARRTSNPTTVQYQCAKVMAELTEDKQHILTIKKVD